MKEKILEKISQEEIFQYYFPEDISMSKSYTNPIRKDDTSPGCIFKYLGDTLFFVDFAYEYTHMDCFRFIQELYGLSFKETLVIISKDFGLNIHKIESLDEILIESVNVPRKKISFNKAVTKEDYIIKVITQAFSAKDLEYWEQFGITLGTLQHFNVKPCQEVWINNFLYHTYKDSDPVYRYREKDKFKIYRPLADKKYKWRTNMAGGLLEGWEQLPEKGDILFVTKSRKDVMTLFELGYSAISTRSESAIVSENAAELLSNRFNRIYSWFDNDKAGIKFSKKQCEKYNWKYMSLYDGFPKDPSDFVKKYSLKELFNIINITLK